MPSPGDPSFDRQQRAARAKLAASDASGERLAELRAKYLAPSKPATRAPADRTTRTSAPAAARARIPSTPKVHPIDTAGIARTARAALDRHPETWTSYAELCSAMGMTRSSARTIAGQHLFERPGPHWFRIRNDDGVFEAPPADDVAAAGGTDGAGSDGPSADDADADADAELVGIGVAVVDGRADPARKLGWNGSAWTLPGSE